MSAKAKEPVTCTATMLSRAVEGHEHTCLDVHVAGTMHRCSTPTCGRYFGQA